MRFLTVFISLLLLCSCSNAKNREEPLNVNSPGVIVLKYGDFGPPQLSQKLLGNKWWQWDDPENHKPVKYDVKVVVYRGVDLDLVKKTFPIVPEKKQDYRYVNYQDASDYFTKTIAELEDELYSYSDPEGVGEFCIYPMKLYKTALAMEKKLRK